MQQSLNLTQIQKSAGQFLHRYHVLIFVLTVIGGLSLATFMINQAINTAQPPATTTEGVGGFDNDTMDKVKSLRKPTEDPDPLVLPNGRVNPFR